MTTINLQQEQQNTTRAGAQMRARIIAVSSPLIIILIAWAVLAVENYLVLQKDQELLMQISASSATLNSDKSVENILDLQDRLKKIKDNLGSKIEINEVLNKITSTIVSGVTLSSYVHTDKKLLLTLNANNFDSIAKQVFSFKQVDFLSEIEVKSVSRDEEGVKCEVAMTLK